LNSLAKLGETTLLVLRNFHRFLGSPELVQAIENRIAQGRNDRTFVIVLAPLVQIPVELERLMAVIEHPSPDRDELARIARGIASESGELPEGNELAAVLDASAGLTRIEAENAFSLALVRHGRLRPEVIWELKSQALKASGLLTLYRGAERFSELAGLASLQQFCVRSLRSDRPANVRARGVLLLGVPGTGKSAFAKALGHETGRPTLILDIGALMGSLVGETERRVREALNTIDAMAPCIVFVDELEKALGGASSGSTTDSGVGTRLFGTLLSWLNDHESDVFFIGTSNDISKLPPEFVRAERFDAMFFLDLPGSEDKDRIWQLYLDRFNLAADQPRPLDRDWTGAEIRACCRLAALLGLSLRAAAEHVVPVAITAGESVERLRQWASGRCLDASRPGRYSRGPVNTKPLREIHRDPSAN
jgi:hypothetical protein